MNIDLINKYTISKLRTNLNHEFTNVVKAYIFASQNSIYEIKKLLNYEYDQKTLYLLKDLQSTSAYIGADYLMKICIDLDNFIQIQDQENIKYCIEELERVFAMTRNELSLSILN